MNILFISNERDTHISAVKWGLLQFGFEPIIFDWSEFPNSIRSTWELNSYDELKQNFSFCQNNSNALFDVVWNRRRGKPTAPSISHPDDVGIIEIEAEHYLQSTLHQFANSKTLWVNSPHAAYFAKSKPQQLLNAKKIGFFIPDTLISNNAPDVKRFLRKHKDNAIYKSFNAGGWYNSNGKSIVMRTSQISIDKLPSDDVINSCPGIYQESISKLYEIRVTVIGDAIFSAAIYSQENCKTTDWRFDIDQKDLHVEKVELPESISSKCLQLCREMNLVFGCIDLIFTKSGDYIFLEINEGGQFLWKELRDPRIKLLDAFCKFLIRGNNLKTNKTISLLDYINFKNSEI